MLEVETQRSRYFENLLLKRAGLISDNSQVEDTVEYLPVHRAVTLSQVRRAAEEMTRKKDSKTVSEALAENHELTDAERLFEDELSKQKRTN